MWIEEEIDENEMVRDVRGPNQTLDIVLSRTRQNYLHKDWRWLALLSGSNFGIMIYKERGWEGGSETFSGKS